AEDGIRDRNVTRVQTCALPIFRGDFVLGALAQGAAVAGVQALGAFADHDEVNLTWISQRRYRSWVQLGRAQVNVVVQCKAQLQQQATLQNPRRYLPWRPNSTQQNSVMFTQRLQVFVAQ